MSRVAVNKKPRVKGVSKDSAQAREKIIDAAIELFARQGYKGASTEKIAAQAGYGQATIFFHFKTKEGLLRACLGRAREHLTEPTRKTGGPRNTVEMLREIDARFADDKIAAFFARMITELIDDEALRPIYAEMHADLRELLSQELIRETGASQKKADFAAGALICMTMGIHIEHNVEHMKFSRSDYTGMLELVGALITDHLKKSERA